VDPDDGCGRTTRQGRTVTAPVAATATAAAHSVTGSRSTWPAHIPAHGAHVASYCRSSGESFCPMYNQITLRLILLGLSHKLE